MKSKIKRLPKSEVELEIEVEAEVFEKFFENTLSQLTKELKLPGFRKGKVSREIALEKIGLENVLMEAAKIAVRESYLQTLSENKLEAISQPKIEILKVAHKNPFCFRASFFVLPGIELPDYKKISSEVKKRDISVGESEVKETLSWLQKSRSTLKPLNRVSQKGDFVEIEFSCPQIEKGTPQKDNFVLGEGHALKDFEGQIENMKEGEQKKFSVTFPKDHPQKEIAGKTIDFDVKMLKVSEVQLSEINDQFAKDLGKFESLEKLKENIKEGIKMEKATEEGQRIREEILSEIEKALIFEVPEILIEAEKQRMLSTAKQTVPRDFKISFEEYLEKVKKSEKEILDSFEAEAKKRIKRSLVLREIAKNEKIAVSEEETKEEINKILTQYPDIDRTKKDIDLEGLKSYTEEIIRNEKVLTRLESFIQ